MTIVEYMRAFVAGAPGWVIHYEDPLGDHARACHAECGVSLSIGHFRRSKVYFMAELRGFDGMLVSKPRKFKSGPGETLRAVFSEPTNARNAAAFESARASLDAMMEVKS